MSDSNTHSNVHDSVSRAYTDALERSQRGETGCCGPACCGGETSVHSEAAQSVGYGEDAQKYREASASSFGCGNPLAMADVGPGQTVLDLGSGAGLDLLIAADSVGPTGRVIGVDMTDAMLAAAGENIARSGHENIEVRKGTIEALPVEDASVDWVISNCVINLSPDKPAVFKEIARVLKPSGRFSISDIVADDLPEWVQQSAAAYAACVGGAISEGDYLAGMRAAGLNTASVADRYVYNRDQLLGLIGQDLGAMGLPQPIVDAGLDAVDGKVWSARFVGGR